MTALLFVAIASAISLAVSLIVGAGMALGETGYERALARIDDEVIAFAATIPDGLS